jgi:hypothetical protein
MSQPRVALYFGDDIRCREWHQAGIYKLLLRDGIDTTDILDVSHTPWRQALRRGWLRTLIYTEMARQGSVTAETKLKRRTALRQNASKFIAQCSKDGITLARFIEYYIPLDAAVDQQIYDLNPALIVLSTDIYRGQEVEIIKAARKHAIPTLGLISSWDTLSAKGPYLVPPDHIAVWGQVQRQQAIQQGFRSDQVHIVGSLRLDAPADYTSVVLPTTPYVVVAGTSLSYWKHEEQMVLSLGELGRKEGFLVWYRPHPRRLGRLEGDLHTLRVKWGKSQVIFDAGNRIQSQPEPPGRLKAILSRAHAVVTTFSTVAVEAALCGTPSMLVGFGVTTEGMEGDQYRVAGLAMEHAKFEHMSDVVSWPGVNLCQSYGDLTERVLWTVKNGPLTRLNAEALRSKALEVVEDDGLAATRLTKLILSLREKHGR